MSLREIMLKLDESTLRAAMRLAQDSDVTLGQFVRVAVEAEIQRRSRNAKTPNRADERLLASLRTLLAADFAHARSWADLSCRLSRQGFALREAGGGLALHRHPSGERLCKASELGHSYATLMRCFDAPFPGHSHRYLADRMLGRPDRNDITAAPSPRAS